MEFKEIDMQSLNLGKARSLNHAIFFVTKRSLYGRYIYVKQIWLRLRTYIKFDI